MGTWPPTKSRLRELIAQALVEACGETEQRKAFFTIIDDNLARPFEIWVLGAVDRHNAQTAGCGLQRRAPSLAVRRLRLRRHDYTVSSLDARSDDVTKACVDQQISDLHGTRERHRRARLRNQRRDFSGRRDCDDESRVFPRLTGLRRRANLKT